MKHLYIIVGAEGPRHAENIFTVEIMARDEATARKQFYERHPNARIVRIVI